MHSLFKSSFGIYAGQWFMNGEALVRVTRKAANEIIIPCPLSKRLHSYQGF